MADNRKYYYLKLKENYFDDDSILLLESMQDGILYSYILLKLYLMAFIRFIRREQSGQYFARLDLGTNKLPQTAQGFIWSRGADTFYIQPPNGPLTALKGHSRRR